ncbi:hypothetical protein THRCLA_03133 [Thraustotheca clavata]|uniref:PHD-type domain-containing protein n=1 Tax=Thraustotheca clavata TaxID=74557 RepID=A0A1W0A3M8_9STRA|nr:hypothetical protein THRCLA_03133 [Thraustotheca clavata]
MNEVDEDEQKANAPVVEKKRAGRGRPPRSENGTSSKDPVKRIVSRVRARLTQLRYHMTYLDAYEMEGWRKSSSEKLKPSAELEKIRRKLRHGKQLILSEIREFQAVFADHIPLPRDASEVNDEDILCAKCQLSETSIDNDILICESIGCNRVYHQQCLEPVLLTKDIPPEDKDWYCQLCLGLFEALKLINLAFGTTWETVEEIFPELKEATAGINSPISDSDDVAYNEPKDSTSGDDDFVDEQPKNHTSKAKKNEDGVDDEDMPMSSPENSEQDGEIVEGKRKRPIVDYEALIAQMPPDDEEDEDDDANEYEPSAQSSSDNSSEESSEEEDPDTLIVTGKRNRTQVDYRALNGQLFPNSAGDEEDDAEYSPSLAPVLESSDEGENDDDSGDNEHDTSEPPVKRRPGRPRKHPLPEGVEPRKRVRTTKNQSQFGEENQTPDSEDAPSSMQKKRGQPQKPEEGPPKKRGRPTKQANTTLSPDEILHLEAAEPTSLESDLVHAQVITSVVEQPLGKRRRTPVDYIALSGELDYSE